MNLSAETQDWIAWVITNIVIGIFTPAFGMFLMSFQNKATARSTKNKSNFAVDYYLPYRDGQLGYVSMAWCAAAIVELVRALLVRPTGGQVLGLIFIGVIAIANAWIAALGASAPTEELQRPHTFRAAWSHYPNLRYSLYWLGAALIGSGVVHYVTMPILGGKNG
jgi:hypothetical protein